MWLSSATFLNQKWIQQLLVRWLEEVQETNPIHLQRLSGRPRNLDCSLQREKLCCISMMRKILNQLSIGWRQCGPDGNVFQLQASSLYTMYFRKETGNEASKAWQMSRGGGFKVKRFHQWWRKRKRSQQSPKNLKVTTKKFQTNYFPYFHITFFIKSIKFHTNCMSSAQKPRSFQARRRTSLVRIGNKWPDSPAVPVLPCAGFESN